MSSRSDGDRINLGEAKGSLGFIWGLPYGTAVEPDPQYITFKLYLTTTNTNYTARFIEEIEFDFVNKD